MTSMAVSKSALLLIDIQQGMFYPEHMCHAPGDLLENAADLLARARSAGALVIHIQHCDPEGPLKHKSAGWRIHRAVAPRDGEPMIEKWACSAFFNTDLDGRLRAAGVNRLAVAGLQTEYCVDTACRVAQSLGYAVALAADAHSTFDTPILSAEKIIAHHNSVLSEIVESVAPARDIRF
jgi:nicotinamidase-related amidase